MMNMGPAKAYVLYTNILEKYASIAAGITSENDYINGVSVSALSINPAFEPCRQGETLMQSAEQLNQGLRQKRQALGLPEEWDDLIDNDDAVPLDDLSDIFENENHESDEDETTNKGSFKKRQKESKIKKKKKLSAAKKRKPLSKKTCKVDKSKLNHSFKVTKKIKSSKLWTSFYQSAKLKKRKEEKLQALNRSVRLKQRLEKIKLKEKNEKQTLEKKKKDDLEVLNRSARLKRRLEKLNSKEIKDKKQTPETKRKDDLQVGFCEEKTEMEAITIGEKVKLRSRKCRITRNSASVDKKTKTITNNNNCTEMVSKVKSKPQMVKELRSLRKDDVVDNQLSSKDINGELRINHSKDKLRSKQKSVKLPNGENNGLLHNGPSDSEQDKHQLRSSQNNYKLLHNVDNCLLHNEHLHGEKDGRELPSKENNGDLAHSEDNGQLHVNEGFNQVLNNDANDQLHSERNGDLRIIVNNDEILTDQDNDVLHSNEDSFQLVKNCSVILEKISEVENRKENCIKTKEGKSQVNDVNQEKKQLKSQEDKLNRNRNIECNAQSKADELRKCKTTFYSVKNLKKFKKSSSSINKFCHSKIALIGLTFLQEVFLKKYENHASIVDLKSVIHFSKAKDLEKILILKPSNEPLKEKDVCVNECENQVDNVNNIDIHENNGNNVVEKSKSIENTSPHIISNQEKASVADALFTENISAGSGLPKEIQCLSQKGYGLDQMEENIQDNHVVHNHLTDLTEEQNLSELNQSKDENVCLKEILNHTEINSETQANTDKDLNQKQGEAHELYSEVNSQNQDGSARINNSISNNEGVIYEDMNKKNYESDIVGFMPSENPKSKANTIKEMKQNQPPLCVLNLDVNTKVESKNKNSLYKTSVNKDEPLRNSPIAYGDINDEVVSTVEKTTPTTVTKSNELITTEEAAENPMIQREKKADVKKSQSKGNKNNITCKDKHIEESKVDNCKSNGNVEIENHTKQKMLEEAGVSERPNNKGNAKENKKLGDENSKMKIKKAKFKRKLKRIENTFEFDASKNTNNETKNNNTENQYLEKENCKKKNKKSKTERILKSIENTFLTVESKTAKEKDESNGCENINFENEKNIENINTKSKKTEGTRLVRKGKYKDDYYVKNSDCMNNVMKTKESDPNCQFSSQYKTRNKKIETDHDTYEESANIKRTKVNMNILNSDKNDVNIDTQNKASQRKQHNKEGKENSEEQNSNIVNCNKKSKKTKVSTNENTRTKRIEKQGIKNKQVEKESTPDTDKLKSRFRCRKEVDYHESFDDIDYESDSSKASWKGSKVNKDSEVSEDSEVSGESKVNEDSTVNKSSSPAWKTRNSNDIRKNTSSNDSCHLVKKFQPAIGDKECSGNSSKIKKKLRLKHYITPPKSLQKTKDKKDKKISNISSNNKTLKVIMSNHSSSSNNIDSLNRSCDSSLRPREIGSSKSMSKYRSPKSDAGSQLSDDRPHKSDDTSHKAVECIAVNKSSETTDSYTEKEQSLSNTNNNTNIVNPLTIINDKNGDSNRLCHDLVDGSKISSCNLQKSSLDTQKEPENTLNKDQTKSDHKGRSIEKKIQASSDSAIDETNSDKNKRKSDSSKKKKLKLAYGATPPAGTCHKNGKSNAERKSFSSSIGSNHSSLRASAKKSCLMEGKTDKSHNSNGEHLTTRSLSNISNSEVYKTQYLTNNTNIQRSNDLNTCDANESDSKSLVNSTNNDQKKHSNQDIHNADKENSRNKDNSQINTFSSRLNEKSIRKTGDPVRNEKNQGNVDFSKSGIQKEKEKEAFVSITTENDSQDNCVDLRNVLLRENVSGDDNVEILSKESAAKNTKKLGQFIKPPQFQKNLKIKKIRYKESLNSDRKFHPEETIIAGIDPQKKKRKQKDHLMFDSTHKYVTEGKAAFCSIAELRKKSRADFGMVSSKSASQSDRGIEEISAIEAEITEKIPTVKISKQITASSKLIDGISGAVTDFETTEKLPAIRENEEETFESNFKVKEMTKRINVSKCSNSSDEDATATLLSTIRPCISSHSYPSISSMVNVARTKSQSSVPEITKDFSTASSVSNSVSAKIGSKNYMGLGDSDEEEADIDEFVNDILKNNNKFCQQQPDGVSIPPLKRPRIESISSESGFESGYTQSSSHLSSGFTTTGLTHHHVPRLKNHQTAQSCSSSIAFKNSSSFKKPRLKIAKPR